MGGRMGPNGAEWDSLTEAFGEIIEHVEALRRVGESCISRHISQRLPENGPVSVRGRPIRSRSREPVANSFFSPPPGKLAPPSVSSSKCKTSELVGALRQVRMFRRRLTPVRPSRLKTLGAVLKRPTNCCSRI